MLYTVPMELYIKNMVCNRCIKVVKDELIKMGLTVEKIELGKVEISSPKYSPDLTQIKNVLEANGFELLEDKKAKVVEKIKNLVIELIYSDKLEFLPTTFSSYLEKKLAKDYSSLSNLFSSVENITIEKYIINQKIERVKELLVYNELTLSEIAFRLGYSSVQHLSNQFKKNTGLTPSHFKKIKELKRNPIDML